MDTNSVEAAYDQASTTYDEDFVTSRDKAEDAVVARHLSHCLQTANIDPARRLLDLGCGTGHLLTLIDVEPNEYGGVDISSQMLDRARAKHPLYSFHHGEMTEWLGRTDEKLGAIVSLFAPLNYCPAPGSVLRRSRDRLLPGGLLYTVTFGMGCQRHHEKIQGGMLKHVPAHYFDPETLVQLYRTAGFHEPRILSLNSTLPESWPTWLHGLALKRNLARAPSSGDRFHIAYAFA